MDNEKAIVFAISLVLIGILGFVFGALGSKDIYSNRNHKD